MAIVIHCKITITAFGSIYLWCVCLCVISGLSKWVRQLVRHHDTFSNAMQSLVAFCQVQQKVEVFPADSQSPSSSVSSPNGHLSATVEEQGLSKASEPQMACSYVKPHEPQPDTSPSTFRFFSLTQLKAEQNGKAGEPKWSTDIRLFLCCKVNTSL